MSIETFNNFGIKTIEIFNKFGIKNMNQSIAYLFLPHTYCYNNFFTLYDMIQAGYLSHYIIVIFF